MALRSASEGILSDDNAGKREELIGLLKKAYWMEVETVMSYIANSINPEGVRAEEIKKSLQADITAEIADLGQDVPVDHSVPWNPKDLDNWSVRWVLLHLIQETARHAGHADIIREAVDGGTAYPIMAAAEGWPESPWMKPWQPSS